MARYPGGADLETVRGRLILEFLRADYNGTTLPILEYYIRTQLTHGNASEADPAYRLFLVLSDDVRTAMDHLGRAAVAPNLARIRAELGMAAWHLNLALIRAMVQMCDSFDAVTTRLMLEQQLNDQAILFDKLRHDARHLALLEHVLAHMRSLDDLRTSVRPPRLDEMAATEGFADGLAISLRGYAELFERIKKHLESPPES